MGRENLHCKIAAIPCTKIPGLSLKALEVWKNHGLYLLSKRKPHKKENKHDLPQVS